jgi:hypothetical protein
MPRRLSRPADVPADRQPLIAMLWRFYIAANGPSARKIADAISALDDDQRGGTANHETVRVNGVRIVTPLRRPNPDPHDGC